MEKSIKTNIENLQSILETVNNLPEVGANSSESFMRKIEIIPGPSTNYTIYYFNKDCHLDSIQGGGIIEAYGGIFMFQSAYSTSSDIEYTDYMLPKSSSMRIIIMKQDGSIRIGLNYGGSD